MLTIYMFGLRSNFYLTIKLKLIKKSEMEDNSITEDNSDIGCFVESERNILVLHRRKQSNFHVVSKEN